MQLMENPEISNNKAVKLSIIIVNYNVKYFLLQLLQSVYRSQTDFDFEVIITDNASTDGSESLIRKEFPQVTYIQNDENLGFSIANNQAIKVSQAPYILLLNPDTILQENTLQETVSFMDQHRDAGAVGCRMIDGSGNFLPESKRGFPSPQVAFFKAFGLGSIFPRSKFFNAYYLGHLDEFETNEVDVLTGAFMLLRKKVLDDIGLLDERFFMYGEDIDMSYRVKQAGHKVYYHPQTSIIHFKGESTNKDTFNYIRTFYGAMKDFARKHYSGQKASLLNLTLNLAIYVRAALTLVRTTLTRFGLPLLEYGLIWLVLFLFTRLWASLHFGDQYYYDSSYLKTNISIYALIWVSALYFLGAYDKKFAWIRILRGVVTGWVLIAALYGLFGPALRPSRALVVVSGSLVFVCILLSRILQFRISNGHWKFLSSEQRRYIIIGDRIESQRIHALVQLNHPSYTYLGQVSCQESMEEGSIGHVSQLDQIARFFNVREFIFCSKSLSSSQIMRWMTRLGQRYEYKMAPDHSISIIGSRSKNLPGELYTFDMKYQIDDPYQRRNKRMLDFLVSLILLVFSPFMVWLVDEKRTFLPNVVSTLTGGKTWVSYGSDNTSQNFPAIKTGILTPVSMSANGDQSRNDLIKEADFYYARDYTVWKDLNIIIANYSKLGNR